MFNKMILALGVLASTVSMAATEFSVMDLVSGLSQNTMVQARTAGINWVVGDACHYNLTVGSFIKGTLDISVREKSDEGFWLDQNADLGFMGKQAASMLIDANTGAVKKILVDGKEQPLPDQNDMEIVETKESNITVPAGTFDAIYFKIHDKKQNQDSEQWVNPKLIPISGALKSAGQTQMGPLVTELVSFVKK